MTLSTVLELQDVQSKSLAVPPFSITETTL